MKATHTKTILALIPVLLTIGNIQAQSNNWWRSNGNNSASGDFIGTTNNMGLNFRTNNIQRMSINTNGDVILNSLTGIGNRILMTSPTGQIIPLPQGASNQVLFGDGTWGTIPTVTGTWFTNGNKMYYNGGYVGVGTNNPQFSLDVIGDARVSNNLYVGGGIVITDKVMANDKVNTTTLEADSIKMSANTAIYGLTKVIGDIDAKNKLSVTGISTFNSELKAMQGLSLDNFNHGFKFISNGTGGGTFAYGKSVGGTLPLVTPCAAQPSSPFNHSFGGILQIFDADNAGNYVPGSGLLNFQTWSGGSSIDASIGGNVGGGGLLLNYFCGNNTFINTGANGGVVFMGDKVAASKSVRIGNDPNNSFDPNTGLTIFQNAPNLNGITFKTNNNNVKILTVDNANFPNKQAFTVLGDGRTYIGDLTQQTGPHSNAMLTVNGKIVGKACYIRSNDWADYVFDSNYKVPSLYDIEKYYLENKHLPEIPTEKEVIEKGIDVGEMNKLLLKKIEEMTILMVGQQKEIDALKAKVK